MQRRRAALNQDRVPRGAGASPTPVPIPLCSAPRRWNGWNGLLKAGFFRYLTKPVEMTALLATVQEAFDKGMEPAAGV